MTSSIDLRSGAVVVRVEPSRGGRASSVRVHDHELLVGQGTPGDDPRTWGSYLMAPWVGRMDGARFPFGGREHRFIADFGPHAIHGLVLDRPWIVDAADGRSVTMRIELGPLGWPFGGSAVQRIRVWPDRVRFSAWVTADEPAPVALGWHPWFRRGESGPDTVIVEAAEILQTRPDLVATGLRLPVDATTDLRPDQLIGSRRLDHTYVHPTAPVTLHVPPLTVRLEWSRQVDSVHVYTPERAICIEPMTAWPNAANLAAAGVRGTGLTYVGARGRLAAWMTWRWELNTH
ncbi:MAG: hypothetical protein C0498_00640 [Anaerolinea sp.]|nr:hypothetical protein [Anaerolinea sp.]